MKLHLRFIFGLLILLQSSCSFFSEQGGDHAQILVEEPEPEVIYNCSSAREFITAYQFLRSLPESKVTMKEAHKLALSVAGGCSGAAKRFIQVAKVLLKSNVDARSAFFMGVEFATSDDPTSTAFLGIFAKSFLTKYLDLDVTAALRLARSLSIDYKGKPEKSMKDFGEIVKYCLAAKGFDLPKPKCAEIAEKVTRFGQIFVEPVAEPFILLFKFLRSDEEGPRIPSYQALKIATRIVEISPYAPANFQQAYLFAASKRGFELGRGKAIGFANKIAQQTRFGSRKLELKSESHTRNQVRTGPIHK